MFTVQSIMLVSLGFLLALLLAFAVAPLYWGRAVRLTSERLRQTPPISEAEIRAEKDRLRAQHAIRVHQLSSQVDTARMSAARQKVEINRREASIGDLQRQVNDFTSNLEASENARRVLEQTILDRVPRVEERLSDARKLLFQRDREMAALQADTAKTFRALDEAMQINAQQRLEIDRLKASLATRTSRGGRGQADPAHDAELALRSELEALRTRVRDQASLIAKLQELVGQKSDGQAADSSQERKAELEAKVAELDTGLANAKNILESVAQNDDAAVEEQAAAMRALRTENEAHVAEIEKLKAALQVYEAGEKGANARPLRDSRIALKARVAALEKETSGQSQSIKRLRAELASANDRSARQAAQHLSELRRLGAGTVPATVSSRDQGDARNGAAAPSASPARPSLAERITERVPTASADLARAPAVAAVAARPANGKAHETEADAISTVKPVVAADRPASSALANENQDNDKAEVVAIADTEATTAEENPAPRRGGLLQRIAGLGKT